MYTIVVVDDEEELRHAILSRINWEKIGFKVVGDAANGIDALELIEKYEPDLLLSDIRMPFVSGLELARQVREICPATQIAFLSGYDEFTYAQEAIQYNIISYMLKPISMEKLTEELTAIRDKIDKIYEDFRIRKAVVTDMSEFVVPLLLDGYDIGSEQDEDQENRLINQAVLCGIIKNRNFLPIYTVMVTIITDNAGTNITSPEYTHVVDTIMNKYMNGYHFYACGKIVSLLVTTKATYEKYMHILVSEIDKTVDRILGYHAVIGVSRITDRLTGCSEAYREAMDAVRYSSDTTGGVHYIADEERSSSADIERLITEISGLETIIRGVDEEALQAYIKEMFDELRSDVISRSTIRLIMIQIWSMVCQIVYAVASEEELSGFQTSEYTKAMTDFDGDIIQAEKVALGFCKECISLVASQRRKSSEVLCDQAFHIIDTQYSDTELTLVKVSEDIGVSPNYLSTIIKKNRGQTFVDILTSRRIEEAKKLITSSTMKIREISEKCGYSDQHYFSFCFKKYTGLSPNAMRQSLQEQ